MAAPRRQRRLTLRGTALAGLSEGEATPPPPYLTAREEVPGDVSLTVPAREGSFLTQRLGPAGGAPAWLWMLGAFAAIAGVGWWQRRAIMKGASMAFDYAKSGAFKAVLSLKEPDAVPYADLILAESQRADVGPFITVALGKRESNWRRSLDAQMTGDYTARVGSWLKEAGVRTVQDADSLPSPWRAPKDSDGNTIPGPYAIPEDGLGWGRGIMQIDWPRVRAKGHDWRNPQKNIAEGLVVYKEKLAELLAAPSGSWTISAALAKRLRIQPGTYPAKAIPADLAPVAALAAYNAGSAAIRRAYSAAGQAGIDLVTTGGDYATATSQTITALTQAFNQQTRQA